MDDAGITEQRLWDFVYAYDEAYDRAARDAGLSAAQACLLKAVSEQPRKMGELAALLLCDASNVTQLVSRLEARGLVARQADSHDRRSRTVAITRAGDKLARQVRENFAFPRDRIDRLPRASREVLSGLLLAMLEET